MIKKVLHGLMVMSAAAVISVGVSSFVADAAAVTPANYTVDYANQKIDVIDTGKNSKIYVGKATITTNKKTNITTVKTAAATEYDLTAITSGKATIDLSSFAVTKDVYLSIWGNVTTDPILVKLPAANTKLKAVVDAVNTRVAIQDITNKNEPVEISGTQYCTTNGTWADYTVSGTKATTSATTAVSLTDYTKLGSTLRFRVTASASAKLTVSEKIGVDAGGNDITAWSAVGNFASNEIKAKIAKTANGPKATIDYNTCTIKVPNTTEYRSQALGKALGSFTAATGDAKTVVLDAASVLTATGAEFDLRTAATDKKPASKITEYKFDAIGTVTAQTSAGKAFTAVTQDVTDTKIKDAEISVTKLVLNSKTMAGTMTVKNDSAEGYQFIVADAQDATTVAKLTLPTASDKVTGTVAAGKTANIKVKSGQQVFIRKAADTKKMIWATPYVYYGVVSNTLG